jgi:hypothetical protein
LPVARRPPPAVVEQEKSLSSVFYIRQIPMTATSRDVDSIGKSRHRVSLKTCLLPVPSRLSLVSTSNAEVGIELPPPPPSPPAPRTRNARERWFARRSVTGDASSPCRFDVASRSARSRLSSSTCAGVVPSAARVARGHVSLGTRRH